MEEIEKLVNAWYKQWLLTNDPFMDDFEADLEEIIPNYKFGLDKDAWFIINKI